MTIENPDAQGWYRTGPSLSMKRWWNGLAWSAPCYVDDPEHIVERARNTPAESDPEQWGPMGVPSLRSSAAILGSAQVFLNRITAADILDAAAKHIRDRAQTYDQPEGERSMEATVRAFNEITNHEVTESEGWLFMSVLKMVRDRTAPNGHTDSQEDCAAYVGLAAEARRAGR